MTSNKIHVSTQELLDQHTEMLEHQTEVLEELRTGMSALPNGGVSTMEEDVLSKKPEMWHIIKIIIPKIKSKWEDVAYSMKYDIPAVKRFKTSGDDACCCKNLFTDWLSTNNGIIPKTWCTLLKCIKDVEDLQVVAETIEEQILKELS